MSDVIFFVERPIETSAQVKFLEVRLSRWLTERGLRNEHIKFGYRLEFPGEFPVYIGTGAASRVASRLSGVVQQYDNSDVVEYTEKALLTVEGRRVVVVGLFLTKASWDPGYDVERYLKQKWVLQGGTLLNRNDLRPPCGQYEHILLEDWLGNDGVEEFEALAVLKRRN